MTGEISFDLVMDADNSFAEGTYRVGGGPWQVFIANKRDVSETTLKVTTWDSGIEGIVVKLPRNFRLDKAVIKDLLSKQFSVTEWVEVRGPDSMSLR